MGDALRAIFNKYDKDDDKKLTKKEFQKLFQAIDADMSTGKINRIFATVDANDNGTISYNEFFNWIDGFDAIRATAAISSSSGKTFTANIKIMGNFVKMVNQSHSSGSTAEYSGTINSDGQVKLKEVDSGKDGMKVTGTRAFLKLV